MRRWLYYGITHLSPLKGTCSTYTGVCVNLASEICPSFLFTVYISSYFHLPFFFLTLDLNSQFFFCKLLALNVHIAFITLVPPCCPRPTTGHEADLLSSCTDTHIDRHSSTFLPSTLTQNRQTSPTPSPGIYSLSFHAYALSSGCYKNIPWTW